jgi:hypothetical protein
MREDIDDDVKIDRTYSYFNVLPREGPQSRSSISVTDIYSVSNSGLDQVLWFLHDHLCPIAYLWRSRRC